ncbi:MAG: hypothetical protein HQK95_05870 [Nitrospirae bacterium]|nr:hypothetical protein [Nitrospirota bacterium]
MKVADLNEDEFVALMGRVIEEKFRELFDPDSGLELRDDFVKDLEMSISDKERISFDEVKRRLGLN